MKMSQEIFDFTIEELQCANVNSTTERINLGLIIDKLHYLDFNPPYQRGKVWRKSYQTDLFRSIFDKTPIGAIHFVLKSDKSDDVKYVLDAKQRLLTIKAFKDGELILRIKDEKGKICQIKWKDIIDPESKWHFLHTKILSFQVDIVTWRPRDMEQQKIIFSRVNNSVSLNAWERIYGDYFIVKKLLIHIFDNYFVEKSVFNKSVSNDFRHNGLKLVHMVMATSFGYTFDDRQAARNLSARYLEQSAKKIEAFIASKGFDASSDFDQELIDILGMTQKLEELKKSSKWFGLSLNHKNSLKKDKKFDANFVADIICFFVSKQQDRILTGPYVEQNIHKFAEFVKRYYEYKNENGDKLKKRSTQAGSVKMRFEEMEKIFVECDIDNTIKNKTIKQYEKTMAALDAEKFDPINGLELNDQNVQFDHINPTSTTSNTSIVAISDISNNRKSDQTEETILATQKYIKNNL